MAKQHVWVIEGRRRGAWRVQNAFWSLAHARLELRDYRDGRNPGGEFRIRKYVPAEGGA